MKFMVIFLTINLFLRHYYECTTELAAFTITSVEIVNHSSTVEANDIQVRQDDEVEAIAEISEMPDTSSGYKLGEFCDHDEECQAIINGSSVCMNNKCLCTRGYMYNSALNACYMRAKIGELCQSTDECLAVEFAHCSRSVCVCDKGRAPNAARNSCIKYARLEEQCDVDRDCRIENSKCREGICKCLDGAKMTFDRNFCVIVDGKLVNSPCTNSSQCTMSYAACLHRRCTCILGTSPNNDFTACQKVHKLYGACKANDECYVHKSFCNKGKCMCSVGYTPSTDGLNCAEMESYLLERCIFDTNCVVNNSMCVSNVCECQEGFNAYNRSHCIEVRSFGDSCETSVECQYRNADCVEGTCGCRSNFTYVHSRCERIEAVFGAPCDENVSCLLGELSTCTKNRCVCSSGYEAIGSRECVQVTDSPLLGPTGPNCTRSEQCLAAHSVCRNHRCYCLGMRYMDKGRQNCLAMDLKRSTLMDHCSDRAPCTIKGSECVRHRCLCKQGMVMADDLRNCTPSVEPQVGDECLGDVDCFIDKSECKNSTCQCMRRHQQVDNECQEVTGYLGFSCWNSTVCNVDNSVCFRGRCECAVGPENDIYFISLDEETCVSLGVEGSQTDIPCISDDDCRLNNEVSGECVDDRCIYRVRDPRLMTMVTRLGGQCRFHDECNIAEAECTENQCTCRNSTVESKDRRRCLKVAESIGDDCEEAGQCAFANAACMQSKCLCRRGFGVESGVSEGTECRELRGVGSRCTSDVECEMEGTRCDANKTCECIDGHSAFEGACFEDSFTLMSPCNITFQCKRNLGEHAECRKGLCMCETQFNYDKLSNVCEPQIRSIEHSNSGIQQLPIGLLFFVCPLSMLLKL